MPARLNAVRTGFMIYDLKDTERQGGEGCLVVIKNIRLHF